MQSLKAWHQLLMRFFLTRVTMLAVLLGASRLASGQAAPPYARYATMARSDAWLDSVSRLPLPRQVAAVRARVLADTLLRHRQQFVCLMPFSAAQREAYNRAQQPRIQAELARPAGALLLYVLDRESLVYNYPAQTNAFIQKLDARRIKRITYLKSGTPAAIIYGGRGASGVVLLETADR